LRQTEFSFNISFLPFIRFPHTTWGNWWVRAAIRPDFPWMERSQWKKKPQIKNKPKFNELDTQSIRGLYKINQAV